MVIGQASLIFGENYKLTKFRRCKSLELTLRQTILAEEEECKLLWTYRIQSHRDMI